MKLRDRFIVPVHTCGYYVCSQYSPPAHPAISIHLAQIPVECYCPTVEMDVPEYRIV